MEDLRYPIGNFEFKPFSNDIKVNIILPILKILRKGKVGKPYKDKMYL